MVKVYDSMGEMQVPESAYYGASTQRAVENFPVSGLTMPPPIVRALALIKTEAAGVNKELGLLDPALADAIAQAGGEIVEGKLSDQFPVDVYQTGSGTSTNMNVNEVMAARANEILGGEKQARSPVHPNDHVNLGQSSNDIIPSALHIAARIQVEETLIPALVKFKGSLKAKSGEFTEAVKLGRTHLQDAVPVTLGQEFSGWTAQVKKGMEAIKRALSELEELALGGTAVGTGLNAHHEFAGRTIARVASLTGVRFRAAPDRFAAQGGKEALTALMKAMSAYATSLMKISSDLRLLASGPRGGFGEINLPAIQPGSSIMPGKVNPVLIESALQVGARVMGNDVTVSLANATGILELNVAMPVIGYAVTESITKTGARSWLKTASPW
jgi:fumarate hydratase class II